MNDIANKITRGRAKLTIQGLIAWLMLWGLLVVLISVNANASIAVNLAKQAAVNNASHSLFPPAAQMQDWCNYDAMSLANNGMTGAAELIAKPSLAAAYSFLDRMIIERVEAVLPVSKLLINTLCKAGLRLFENCTTIAQQIKTLLLKQLTIFTLRIL